MRIPAPDNTHSPHLESWVESANSASTDFPIQNLPLGVFRRQRSTRLPAIGAAIGDQILDLRACFDEGLLDVLPPAARLPCTASSLNPLMAAGAECAAALRRRLSDLLRRGTGPVAESALVPMAECELLLPAEIGDYTDFYASLDHATNVGRLFRPDQPLLPNYEYVPVGYHGRASSVMVSGTPVRRPRGQIQTAGGPPRYEPSRKLDYEVEVGMFVGRGNSLGETVPVDDAEEHLFGFCLLNDWSARDIQSWEYQPLGPFLSKSFVTSVSPWVVTAAALAPFRVPLQRPPGRPAALPHLSPSRPLTFDITVEAAIRPARATEPATLSRGRFAGLYWSPAQMIAHHASNGCNLRSGDLLGSGTISGPTESERGCLLELTEGGRKPLTLNGQERRTFLEDGDEVILRAWCEREGARRIGFGECRGVVQPASG